VIGEDSRAISKVNQKKYQSHNPITNCPITILSRPNLQIHKDSPAVTELEFEIDPFGSWHCPESARNLEVLQQDEAESKEEEPVPGYQHRQATRLRLRRSLRQTLGGPDGDWLNDNPEKEYKWR
jgi:hypothetical protein